MKERPIIFNGEMVRAILDGRKTQTRRVVKEILTHGDDDFGWYNSMPVFWDKSGGNKEIECPFGVPGYRLIPAKVIGYDEEGNAITEPISGIVLEVFDIRVERVQDISEEDAIAEGLFTKKIYDEKRGEVTLYKNYEVKENEGWFFGARKSFFTLWDSINGEKPGRAIKDNPWVWVVEFKEVS